MKFPTSYLCLTENCFSTGDYSLVPIRYEDREVIRQWRNEQIYHLRQSKPLTVEDQDRYFSTTVADLFKQSKPGQLLFSYLEKGVCIGYGGLVHINWDSRNAEISFIMNTTLEKDGFAKHWENYLSLIERVAFAGLKFHKLFTYAFDLRKQLYPVIEQAGYQKEAVLREHVFHQDRFFDVIIHSKFAEQLFIRKAKESDALIAFQWANDPQVRKYSFKRETIEWSHHQTWFNSKVNSQQCEYYLLTRADLPIGSIRFDLLGNGQAVISYLIDPAWQGRGYGRNAVKLGMQHLKKNRPEIQAVTGLVMKDNLASIRTFVGLGFSIQTMDDSKIEFTKSTGYENR
jgi:RimJ/RimL family protein N-acetyltransferase